MSLVKGMPVLAISRQLEISDKRLWRIVHHYVGRKLGELDLSRVNTVGLDETASRRGHRYVTVFFTANQVALLQELMSVRSATADAWTIKKKLRWIQLAPTPHATRWRITNYLKVMQGAINEQPLLKPMAKALNTLERHAEHVVRRWISGLTNARLEGMNGLFQAARSRARGYRNEASFIAMIYLIGSPVGRLLDQAKST